MAAKKKTRKSKKPAVRRTAAKKSVSRKRATTRRKAGKKKAAKRAAPAGSGKKSVAKAASTPRRGRDNDQGKTRMLKFSSRQSGDLQGVSDIEEADSESVGELLEEGNAFEADAVAGVEEAGDKVREVRTREVPEDDVPEEYLDKD